MGLRTRKGDLGLESDRERDEIREQLVVRWKGKASTSKTVSEWNNGTRIGLGQHG